MNLTNRSIGKIKPPETGTAYHYDDTLKGFGVRVTASGVKSFIFQRKMLCPDGRKKLKRITIGRFGEITTEQARQVVQQYLARIAAGEVIGDTPAQNIPTLLDAVQAFLAVRNHKNRTRLDYATSFGLVPEKMIPRGDGRGFFCDWLHRPITEITVHDVEQRYRLLAENSRAAANRHMRYLKAVMTYAVMTYDDAQGNPLLARNPVDRLTYHHKIHTTKRKTSYINKDDFPAWFNAVQALGYKRSLSNGRVVSDLLMVLVFTGLRLNEAASLEWGAVNLTSKSRWLDNDGDRVELPPRSFVLLDTKNKGVYRVPMADFVFDIFSRRQSMVADGQRLVFHNAKGGTLGDMRKTFAHVINDSGVQFTPHDLRRTFASRARGLGFDVSMVATLLHHKKGDVTEGYIIYDGLESHMQRIAEAFLREVQPETAADNVVPLKTA